VTQSKEANVFAIHGAEPEVLAYAMAKYSRSSLSMKESIAEISSQKASDFLNTFYFQYGHRSIADLAHVPLALEGISLLAAIEVEDEQRWDGQERSTRYQDFSKREVHVPETFDHKELAVYHRGINELFDGYDELFRATEQRFKAENPMPEGMDPAAYKRTIRARAFDVARALLPMATLTSVGQITSARTLEGQISRMLASPYLEVREIADKIKQAAIVPAFRADEESLSDAIDEVSGYIPPEATKALREQIVRSAALAPTLVKHTEPDTFRGRIAAIARDYLEDMELQSPEIRRQAVETTWSRPEETETEIIATILYEHSQYSYLFLHGWVTTWSCDERAAFLASVLAARGKHDELPRAFRTGGIIFDIRMDIGGFRDMHRHRRTNQFFKKYGAGGVRITALDDGSAQQQFIYNGVMRRATAAYHELRNLLAEQNKPVVDADYLLPLGTEHRFLMKMNPAEAAYIAELRTQPAGHISYRRVAWALYQALRYGAPSFDGIADRVIDPNHAIDFFKR